jgi:hypothetical protein
MGSSGVEEEEEEDDNDEANEIRDSGGEAVFQSFGKVKERNCWATKKRQLRMVSLSNWDI